MQGIDEGISKTLMECIQTDQIIWHGKHSQFPQCGNFDRTRRLPSYLSKGRYPMPAWSPSHGFFHHKICSLDNAIEHS